MHQLRMYRLMEFCLWHVGLINMNVHITVVACVHLVVYELQIVLQHFQEPCMHRQTSVDSPSVF